MKSIPLATIDIAVKVFVSVMLILQYILPIAFKTLYVSETGNFKNIDGLAMILLILGLRYSWRFIGEIIIGLQSLFIFTILFSTYFRSFDFDVRPGRLLSAAIAFLIVLSLSWLKHLYKKQQLSADNS